MQRNSLIVLITFVTLSLFAVGCGGSAESNANSSASAGNNSSMSQINGGVPNNSTVPTGATNTGAPSDATTKSAARNAPMSKDPAPQIGTGGNDMYLFTKTRAALNGDAELKAAAINVSVNAGVVTLTGNVSGEEQKARAEKLARGVEGVTGVKNQLATAPGKAKR